MGSSGYVIVSPVRNEAEFLHRTIGSVLSQRQKPAQWIIVNDGSTDATAEIIESTARRIAWVKCVHLADRGFRQAGTGVMEAFYRGFELVGQEPWAFVVKLDGDLSFEEDYFELCLREFEIDARLGIGGGLVCTATATGPKAESDVDPLFHVRGATKIYRRECWEEIGGLLRAPGWDTLDEVKANMLGWSTRTFRQRRIVHHRPSGDAYGTWSNWVKNGLANYIAGYHPVFMAAKCARRVFVKPYLLGGLGLWAGYTGGFLRRVQRAGDKELLRYFGQQQWNRLLGRRSLWSASGKDEA